MNSKYILKKYMVDGEPDIDPLFGMVFRVFTVIDGNVEDPKPQKIGAYSIFYDKADLEDCKKVRSLQSPDDYSAQKVACALGKFYRVFTLTFERWYK